eukprot:791015-Prymnesium_polylepis.1
MSLLVASSLPSPVSARETAAASALEPVGKDADDKAEDEGEETINDKVETLVEEVPDLVDPNLHPSWPSSTSSAVSYTHLTLPTICSV